MIDFSGQEWDYWDFNAGVKFGQYIGVAAGQAATQAGTGLQQKSEARADTGEGQWYSLEAQYENKYVLDHHYPGAVAKQDLNTSNRSIFTPCPQCQQ